MRISERCNIKPTPHATNRSEHGRRSTLVFIMYSVRISAWKPAVLTEEFCAFPQSFHTTSGVVPSSCYTASLREKSYNTPQRNMNKYPVSQRGDLGWFPVYIVWILVEKVTQTNFLLSSSVSPANSQPTNCSYSLIMVSLSLFFLCA
jgi:hypothetical protein